MIKFLNNKPGRPVSINKETITKKCLEFYWTNGIDNNSFNEVIKHAGVSKGSIYRLYGSEDILQKNVLLKYYNTIMKERLRRQSESTLKNYVMYITSSLITNKLKPCLFYRTKAEKYKLGPKARKYIEVMEKNIKKGYTDLIKRDLKLKNRKINKNELEDLADYLLNSMSTLTLIKLNTQSHKSLLNFSKHLLKQFT